MVRRTDLDSSFVAHISAELSKTWNGNCLIKENEGLMGLRDVSVEQGEMN